LDNYRGFQYGGTILGQKPKKLGSKPKRRKIDAWNKLVMLLGPW
jgi:hypothetical protein